VIRLPSRTPIDCDCRSLPYRFDRFTRKLSERTSPRSTHSSTVGHDLIERSKVVCRSNCSNRKFGNLNYIRFAGRRLKPSLRSRIVNNRPSLLRLHPLLLLLLLLLCLPFFMNHSIVFRVVLFRKLFGLGAGHSATKRIPCRTQSEPEVMGVVRRSATNRKQFECVNKKK
jgi:hypothetical protein